MKLRLAKAAAAVTLFTALVALPTAAHAGTYPPADAGSVSSPTVTPGGTVTFSVAEETFEPGEPVTVTLTGENAEGASLAFVKFAVQTKTLGVLEATADGALAPIDIRFPANASGPYTIAAFSPSNPGVTAVVSIAAAGGGAGGTGTLPATGSDSASLLGVWIGGGALLLAGGALAVITTVRRGSRDRAALSA